MNMQEESHPNKESDMQTIITDLNKEKKTLEGEVQRLQSLLSRYDEQVANIFQRQEEVIDLYKDILDIGNLLGGILSLSERKQITYEVQRTKEILTLGIRSKQTVDVLNVLDPSLFNKLLEKLKAQCLTIVNVLEQFVLTSNASRNTRKTEHTKLKASIHLLSSLMDIRDQNGANDLQIIFGLLCLSFGAGPRIIEVLQHLGLTESFPVMYDIVFLTHVIYTMPVFFCKARCLLRNFFPFQQYFL